MFPKSFSEPYPKIQHTDTMASSGEILVKLGGHVYSIDLTNEILGGIDDPQEFLDQPVDINNNLTGMESSTHQTSVPNDATHLQSNNIWTNIDGDIKETPLIEENGLLYQELSSVFLEHLVVPKLHDFSGHDKMHQVQIDTTGQGSNLMHFPLDHIDEEYNFYDYGDNKLCSKQTSNQSDIVLYDEYVSNRQIEYGLHDEHVSNRQIEYDLHDEHVSNRQIEYGLHDEHVSNRQIEYGLHDEHVSNRQIEYGQSDRIATELQRDTTLCQRCKCEVNNKGKDAVVPLDPTISNTDLLDELMLDGHIDYLQMCTKPALGEFQTEMKYNENREFSEFKSVLNSHESHIKTAVGLKQQQRHLSEDGIQTKKSIMPSDQNDRLKIETKISPGHPDKEHKHNSSQSKDSSNSKDVCHQSRRKLDKGCKIWEFVRNLLLDPKTNPSLIRWENKEEGSFRLIQPKTISKLWGQKKGNQHMNYEKLSRALRYHYKRHVLTPVKGKNLIYKFGPSATGWRDKKL